jgi:hypothetical protein
MEILLYYAPNTCALAPYVTLTEANASFEAKPLNFRKNEHRLPAYLRLNPKHKVPLLMIDGEPLTESPAIQIWIARNFPHAKLLPSDPWQERRSRSCRGARPTYIPICRASTRRRKSVTLAVRSKASSRRRRPFCSRTTRSPTICSLGVNSSSIILQRRMRISSGACDAVRSSAPRLRNSRIAWRISKGSRIKRWRSVQKLFEYEKAVQAKFAGEYSIADMAS